MTAPPGESWYGGSEVAEAQRAHVDLGWPLLARMSVQVGYTPSGEAAIPM
jgi:hypothetical protein